MYLRQYALIAIASAVVYFFLFQLNFTVFSPLESSFGVNWIFIPSGIRLAAILLGGFAGAVGIVLGSLVIVITTYDTPLSLFALGTALISGFSPLLARRIATDLLGLDTELVNLKAVGLLKIALLFSIISASAHQLWFYAFERNDNFLRELFVMGFGDFVGTVIVLLVLEGVVRVMGKKTVD